MIDSLGHYRLLEPMGAGAIGELFRARDTRIGRTVAINLLSERITANPDRLARLLRDARAAAALSHPSIATLFEIGNDNGRPFLVFEFVAGTTLRKILSGQPLPVRRAIDLAAQMADALAEGHAREVAHGNVTLDNVVVTPRERAKLLGFGLAAWTQSTPEQPREEPADPRADLFALGALLYEMLTGRPPAAELHAANRAAASHRAGTVLVRPSTLNRALPKELDAIVLRALAEQPTDRFDTAAEFAAVLRSIELGSRGPGRDRISIPGRRRRRIRVGRWLTLAVLLAAAVGLGWCVRQ